MMHGCIKEAATGYNILSGAFEAMQTTSMYPVPYLKFNFLDQTTLHLYSWMIALKGQIGFHVPLL